MFEIGKKYLDSKFPTRVYDCLYADGTTVLVRREDHVGHNYIGRTFHPDSVEADRMTEYKKPIIHERWIVWCEYNYPHEGPKIICDQFKTEPDLIVGDETRHRKVLKIERVTYEQVFHE